MSTDMAKAIGRRVFLRRDARGWNQSELARRAGIGTSYVNRLEAGVYARPSVERLARIAEALGCRVADLTEPGTTPVAPGIIGQLEAMGLDPVEEAQLMAEIAADVATLPPGPARLDVLRALATLIRPKVSRQ